VAMVKTRASGDRQLVAYIVAKQKETYDESKVYSHLQQSLPHYMIPSILILIDEIPLTQSGKINRKALQEIGISTSHTKQYVAPRNEIEHQLVAIWQEILELEKVGVQDDFFLIGGDSILAIKVMNMINNSEDLEEAYQLNIRMEDIFQYSTIESLAAQLNYALKQVQLSANINQLKELEL